MKNIFTKKDTGHYDLTTKSGEQLLKENTLPWQEYPRPQMKRDNFQMLNGIWKLNGEHEGWGQFQSDALYDLVKKCGGYSMVVEEHHYSKDKEYGYGACKNTEELTDKIVYMYENMIEPFIKDGLCGSVYTQLSDVEDEVNGLYTYDRRVCKVNKDRMRILADKMQKRCKN